MSIYYAAGIGFTPAAPGPFRFVGSSPGDIFEAMHRDISRIRIGDFNGDGMTDIAAVEGLESSSPMSIYLSTGISFGPPIPGPTLAVGVEEQLDIDRVGTGDFNGDGRTDVARNDAWGYEAPMSIYATGGGPIDLLGTIRNGRGGTETITYLPSSVWGGRLPLGLIRFFGHRTKGSYGVPHGPRVEASEADITAVA
jgi:hypothetical protein